MSKRSDKEKKEIYEKWHGLINMSQKALDEWAENPNRLLASINREKAKEEGGIQSGYDSFHRIKRRKGKKFKDWSSRVMLYLSATSSAVNPIPQYQSE